MKRIIFFLLFVASLRLIGQTDIIAPEDFMNKVKAGEKMVVIDANKAKVYTASHIKDAINLNHNDLYQPGDIEGLIKTPEELAAAFGTLGISENTPVVIYDDNSQKYTSRLYWILKYIGARDVKILYKDLEAWKKVRIPLAMTPAPKAVPVKFNPDVQPDFFATLEYVRERKDNPDVVLVDVRTPEEYNGTVENSKGHIPGAININHEELIAANGAFKPVEELKKLFEAKGVTPDKEVILYCRTSVRGTVGFVALHNILGYGKVRVYDGAYLEWIANNNPIVQ